MPLYEYVCPSCGVFEASHPMTRADLPDRCPACSRRSPRILSAVHLAVGKSGRGRATKAREPRLRRRIHPHTPAAPKVSASEGRPWVIGH